MSSQHAKDDDAGCGSRRSRVVTRPGASEDRSQGDNDRREEDQIRASSNNYNLDQSPSDQETVRSDPRGMDPLFFLALLNNNEESRHSTSEIARGVDSTNARSSDEPTSYTNAEGLGEESPTHRYPSSLSSDATISGRAAVLHPSTIRFLLLILSEVLDIIDDTDDDMGQSRQ